jgi:Amidase
VTPTVGAPPPEPGWFTAAGPEQEGARIASFIPYTAQFNMTGQPAVSLPLHWTPGGLPVGVQLAFAYGREDLLIRVASQLEQAVPWSDRHRRCTRYRPGGYRPVLPSISSRMMSACPAWRAVSSSRCMSTQRRLTGGLASGRRHRSSRLAPSKATASTRSQTCR